MAFLESIHFFQGHLNTYHLKDQDPVKHYNKFNILAKGQYIPFLKYTEQNGKERHLGP